MILDSLDQADQYFGLNPHFTTAFTMLRRSNVILLPEGRMEIDGDAVYAEVVRGPGRKPEQAKLETHDKYIDIHYVLSGTDLIGWKARKHLGPAMEKADPTRDVDFYTDEPDAWPLVKPGMFAIHFPEDAHMPMISDNEIHKIIVKVAVK